MLSEIHNYSAERRGPSLRETLEILLRWSMRMDLVAALTKRDVLLKYRGSILGFLWSFITPFFLLAIYTAVFGLIFKAKWGGTGQGGWKEFVVMLFCGLIPFNFYQEAIAKSCQSIVSAPNYVKRIAFPTEVLPLVMTLSAFVHAAINCAVLMGFVMILMRSFHWTFLLLPLIWLPVLISAWACALVAASVGVFIRDLGHLISLAFNVLMFVSPIFYSDSMVPARFRFTLFLNPIAYAASNLRKVCVLGVNLNWESWCLFMGVSLAGLLLAAGYFQMLRRRFADVL
jgi:lipopolysaccharide transport system permease protein